MDKLILFTLLLFVGCGQRLDHIDSNKLPPKGGIEPTAMEYVTSFEDDYGTTVQVSVELKERLKNYCYGQYGCNVFTEYLHIDVDAVCWSSGGAGQRVEIKASRWDEMSDGSREQLIYHELAHCVLDQGHRNSKFKSGFKCKTSIMNEYTFSNPEINNCYLPLNNYYKDELAVYIP